ncbi:Zn-dependent dipeptidase, microsomal dipeptidase [Marinitoga piezophila KA3]|uniref:Zn-dependent dipeptidase, microsomal dipeptidase n=1 Tax=Marinitoga piezophila (strain DSM 14283 / JCM 11233 / KA3) TaxID=443254 RepID=H2J7H6_MARPK|nr:dipeptidase [Marinitoga piezophila]AEX86469.1 Zn-dependent dipeptidase, microsomal dipeptidase [Marinitoga piezophila KA3]
MNTDNYLIIDAHFDLLTYVTERRKEGKKQVIMNRFYDDFKKGKVNIIVSSLFISEKYIPEMALRNALDQIASLHYEIEESEGKIMLCRNMKDIQYAIDNQKLGILLSFEGLDPIGNDLYLLKVFYELGVRFAGLVWSRRNYVADGAFFSEVETGTEGGLSSFGVKIVKEAERLGMLIDVSHLNDSGFWDVIKFTTKPIIASHSNVRKLFNSKRNLTDEQIKAIANNSGVIGINANGMFVTDNNSENNINGLIKHIDYIANLVGVEHVGFGFDLCDMFRDEQVDSLNTHKEIPVLIEKLKEHGYTETEIKKITGENFLRVYKSIL